MNFFFFNPLRFGHYEVMAPLILRLEKNFKNSNIKIIAFENKSFEALKKNKEIFDILSPSLNYYSSHPKNIFSWFKIKIVILNFLLNVIFSKKSIVFLRSISTRLEKLIKIINDYKKGKTYIIPSAIATFEESYDRYFLKNGKKRYPFDENYIKKKECADGYLYYSHHNLIFLKARGFNNFLQIGYPLGFKEFKTFINDNSKKYLLEEHRVKLEKKNTITVQINKYLGLWGNKDEEWVLRKIDIIFSLLSKKFSKANILIRIHPTIDKTKVNYLKESIYKFKYKNIRIYFSNLNSSTLANLSHLTIGLCSSSVFLHSLFMDVPYIEISNFSKEQKKIFPMGAWDTKFGVIPAQSKRQLESVIFSKKLRESLNLFKGQIDIEKNNNFDLKSLL